MLLPRHLSISNREVDLFDERGKSLDFDESFYEFTIFDLLLDFGQILFRIEDIGAG
jgi:hypothetical protein